MTRKRAVVYVRVAVGSDGARWGADAQEAACRRWRAARGLDVMAVRTGASGLGRDAAGRRAVDTLARPGGVDAVVTADLSGLGRDAGAVAGLVQEWAALGAVVVADGSTVTTHGAARSSLVDLAASGSPSAGRALRRVPGGAR